MTTLALSAPACIFAESSLKTGSSTSEVQKVQQPTISTRPEPPDEELISAICLGAEWALETLYQRYYRYAYALAYRILRENTAAEDIEQAYFAGLTHVEIAERNNMPLGTVKGRMRLGLQKMHRLLEEHGLDNTW